MGTTTCPEAPAGTCIHPEARPGVCPLLGLFPGSGVRCDHRASDRPAALAVEPGTVRYHLRPTGQSSSRLGPCEVCGEHCPEVCHQWAVVACAGDKDDPPQMRPIFWSVHGAPATLWGHEACLRGARVQPHLSADEPRKGEPCQR